MKRFSSVEVTPLTEVPLDQKGEHDVPPDGDDEVELGELMLSADPSEGNASVSEMMTTIGTVTIESIKETVEYTIAHWKVVICGQVLSFLLACNGAAQATLHFECSLSAPTFTSGFFYIVLSLFLVPLYYKGRRIRRRRESMTREELDGIAQGQTELGEDVDADVPQITEWHAPHWFLCGRIPLYASPAWVYLGIALLDVEANYFTVLAFRFTTLTSVNLFDALAIPSAMILSCAFLKRRFSTLHFLGVVVCMWGIGYNVMSDYQSDEFAELKMSGAESHFPHRLLGDVLAAVGGIFFGANDVLAEKYVKKYGGLEEYLGMIGLFGGIISIGQAFVLEREAIFDFFEGKSDPDDDGICSTWMSTGLLLSYVATSTLSYIGGSKFLLVSEATLLNLSFLTGDLWSVIFSVFAEKIVPSPLFFVALTLIVSGVLIYEMAPSPLANESVPHYPTNTKVRVEPKAESGGQVAELPLAEGTNSIEVL